MSSILDDTKKILNLDSEFHAFDHDVITHINATFSILCQMGIGPEEGFMIAGASDSWDDFIIPQDQLNLVKSYMYLKVRSIFDPPSTSFQIAAMDKQIEQFEWRLNTAREVLVPPTPEPPEEEL